MKRCRCRAAGCRVNKTKIRIIENIHVRLCKNHRDKPLTLKDLKPVVKTDIEKWTGGPAS